jgi:hypothetical protein
VALVAGPGKAKTPAARRVTRPLAEIDRELREQYRKDKEKWDAEDEHTGPPPVPLRAIVRDITRESLAIVLQDNPRGVLCDPDELTAWANGMGDYKAKGSDRQFRLSIWSSVPVSVDRKGGRESFYVPHPFVAVLGGLPPAMLSALHEEKGRADGFLERILFVWPDDDAFPPSDGRNRKSPRERNRGGRRPSARCTPTP